ncbi:hypothetical protein CDL15_Pgr008694 [Punica granatum]|uniref:Uncharacterized protein n=1 Tax=Punica granatum TaxID=22663 RepID=A0A218WC71_PUNGR|nr:hypothetical protein CDL15_Pgr008694 [Punica granatum]
MGQSASADVPDIPTSIHPHLYLPLHSAHFTAFRTMRPVIAFRTPRPLYCFQDFASPDFVSPDFASGYCFLDSASTLLLSGLHVPGLCIRLLSHDLWLHPLNEHATKEGQAVSTPFWPTGSPCEDPQPRPGALFITRQSEANGQARGHGQ